MPQDAFSDLIPQGPGSNAFADLVPKAKASPSGDFGPEPTQFFNNKSYEENAPASKRSYPPPLPSNQEMQAADPFNKAADAFSDLPIVRNIPKWIARPVAHTVAGMVDPMQYGTLFGDLTEQPLETAKAFGHGLVQAFEPGQTKEQRVQGVLNDLMLAVPAGMHGLSTLSSVGDMAADAFESALKDAPGTGLPATEAEPPVRSPSGVHQDVIPVAPKEEIPNDQLKSSVPVQEKAASGIRGISADAVPAKPSGPSGPDSEGQIPQVPQEEEKAAASQPAAVHPAAQAADVKPPYDASDAYRTLAKLDPDDPRLDPFADEYDEKLHSAVESAFGDGTGSTPAPELIRFVQQHEFGGPPTEVHAQLMDDKAAQFEAVGDYMSDGGTGRLLRSDGPVFNMWKRGADGYFKRLPGRVTSVRFDNFPEHVNNMLESYVRNQYRDPEYRLTNYGSNADYNARVTGGAVRGSHFQTVSEAALKDLGGSALSWPKPVIRAFVEDYGVPLSDPANSRILKAAAKELNLTDEELQAAVQFHTAQNSSAEVAPGGPDAVAPAIGSGDSERPPSPPAEPAQEVAAPAGPPPETTGLANRVQAAEVEAGKIAPPDSAVTHSAVEAQAEGKTAVEAGSVDPETLAAEIAHGQRPFSWREAGALLEGKRRLLTVVNAAKTALDSAIASGEGIEGAKAAYDAASTRLQAFVENVQKGKTEWHNTGQALQAGTEVDTGNFADVLSEFQRQTGRQATPKESADLAALTKQYTDLQAQHSALQDQVAREKAASAVKSAASRPARFDKAALDAELNDLIAQGKDLLKNSGARLSAGVDPTLAADAAKIVGKIALNFAKQGVNSLDEIVAATIQAAKEHFGLDLTPKQVHEAIHAAGEIPAGKVKMPRSSASRSLMENEMRQEELTNKVRTKLQSSNTPKVVRFGRELAATPRAIMTAGHFTAPLRQGLLSTAGHPVLAIRNLGRAFRAFADPVYSYGLEKAINESPLAPVRKEAGLYLSPSHGALGPAEEAFMNSLADRVPGVRQIVAAGQRHFTTFLNQMRVDIFDKAANSGANPEQLKPLADALNVFTGRGNLGDWGRASHELSTAFFSPRFAVSRIQAPLEMLSPNVWKSPVARAEVFRSWAALTATGMGVLYLAKANGLKVGTDPESPDFGKIRDGDTVVDIWGGMAQPVRLFARIGSRVEIANGMSDQKMPHTSVADLATSFLEGKTAPVPRLAYEAALHTDFSGHKVDAAGMAEEMAPLTAQGIAKAWSDEKSTPAMKVVSSIAGNFGTGVESYPEHSKVRVRGLRR